MGDVHGGEGWGSMRWVLAVVAAAGLGLGAGVAWGMGRLNGGSVVASATGVEASRPLMELKGEPRPGDVSAAKPQEKQEEPRPEGAVTEPMAAVPDDGEELLPEEPSAPVVDATRAADAARLAAVIGAAHARLHGEAAAAASDGAMRAAMDAAFGKDKVLRKFAGEVAGVVGVGRFVRGGGLTALGRDVVARVRGVDAEGLDPAPYGLAGLDAALQGLLGAGGAPAPADALTAAVRGLLEAEAFDGEAAAERLLTLEQLPSQVALDQALVQAHGAQPVSVGDLPADAAVFRAFLQLVLDERFIKRAGPTVLRSLETVLERDRKGIRDHIGQIMVAADEGKPARVAALIDPAHPDFRRILEIYGKYRALVAAGGCPELPAGWRFRGGMHGKEVVKLQERLACEGYFSGEHDGRFEGETVAAVRRYQAGHDLPLEDKVGEDMMKSLNTSMEFRVKQIALTLQRMREAQHGHWSREFVLRVNLPAFQLQAFEGGKRIRTQRVIVGTNRLDDDKVKLVQGHINRTKLFGTALYEIIVNPTWILPKRIEEGELATSVEKDADYLGKKNIKKVKLKSGTEVFIQGSGDGNALGKVKFLLEGTNAIYLHDTDKRHLFSKQRRDFSHGCMRVQDAIEVAQWLLARDGADQEAVDRAFRSKLAVGFTLKRPVDFVTEYMTVDLSEDGEPVFVSDIYGYDSAFWNDNVPPTEQTRWGASTLRPRWVPVVDAEQVNAWRKEGKAAPRDLGPDGKPKESKVKDGKGAKKGADGKGEAKPEGEAVEGP